MRCVLAVLFLAAVSAAPEGTFGSSVLAELTSKLEAGAPLDELKSILDDIRARLSAADEADVSADAADKQYCEQRSAKLATDIELENSKIARLTAEIRADNETVILMTQKIAELDADIEQLDKDIAENEQTQRDATEERNLQHRTYLNNTRDAQICIEAIDEIQALGGMDALRENQDDDSSDYQKGVKMAALLEKMSTKITSEDVKALVQISALTVATLDNDDVTRLNQLLQRLEDELKQYKQTIKDDEAEQLRLYNIRMDDLQRANANLRNRRAQLDSERDNCYVTKEAAEGRIKDNTVKKNDSIASRDALVEEKADLEAGCQQRAADHSQRMADRVAERATLDEIESIIDQKLGKHFNKDSHLDARMADVKPTEE